MKGKNYLNDLVLRVVGEILPVEANDWVNVGVEYRCLSGKTNEWKHIRRHWQRKLRDSSEECRSIQAEIKKKNSGQPYTHPAARINYNNNATTSATATQELQQTIQGLQQSIQGLQQSIHNNRAGGNNRTGGNNEDGSISVDVHEL